MEKSWEHGGCRNGGGVTTGSFESGGKLGICRAQEQKRDNSRKDYEWRRAENIMSARITERQP